tara:strand:- start:1651 stop:1914 length:264 start_codon:yes stop_codon:yes gene_type:complete
MNLKKINLKNIPVSKYIQYIIYSIIIILLNNYIHKKTTKYTKIKTIKNILSLFIIFLICENLPVLLSNSIFNGMGYSLGSSLLMNLI